MYGFKFFYNKYFERLTNGLGTSKPLIFFDCQSDHNFDILKPDKSLIWIITLVFNLHVDLEEISVNGRLRQLDLEEVRPPAKSGEVVDSNYWESTIRGYLNERILEQIEISPHEFCHLF